MRYFEFDLRLPDGRIVTAAAVSATWTGAFSTACEIVERSVSLPPNSGIVCRAYRSSRTPGEGLRPAA